AWLWPGRLALGKLAMLDGDPGMGKSLLALDLCARLSTGRPLPDGGAAGSWRGAEKTGGPPRAACGTGSGPGFPRGRAVAGRGRANELLAAGARVSGHGPKRDQVREFLTRTLETGPRTSRELWALAQDQGLSRRTLRRAKLDLGIRSVRVWADGKRLSYWL